MKRSALVATFLLFLLPGPARAGQILEGAVQVPALMATPEGAALVSIDSEGDGDASPELVLRRAGPSGTFDRGTRLAGGAWLPSAGFAANGDGVILFDEGGIRVAPFFADGSVGPSVRLSREGWRASPMALDVAPGGAALALWEEVRDGRRVRLMAALRGPGEGAFGAPRRLFRDVRRPVQLVTAAVGDRGDAVVAAGEEDCAALHAALARPGGGFGRAQRLDRRSGCGADAEVGADGTVLVAHLHVRVRRGVEHYGLGVRRAAPGASRLPRARVLARRDLGTPLDSAITPSGRILLAAGRESTSERTDVEVWDAAPGGPLRRTGIVGRAVASDRVAVDVDERGRAVVAWGQDAPRPGTVVGYVLAMAARRSDAGAPFSQPEPLHEHSFQFMDVLGAVLAPDGGAYVAWSGFGDSDLFPPDGFRGAGVTRLGP